MSLASRLDRLPLRTKPRCSTRAIHSPHESSLRCEVLSAFDWLMSAYLSYKLRCGDPDSKGKGQQRDASSWGGRVLSGQAGGSLYKEQARCRGAREFNSCAWDRTRVASCSRKAASVSSQ